MPLDQRGEVGEISELQAIKDADDNPARPASDERLETVRQQGANGQPEQVVHSTSTTDPEQLPDRSIPDGHPVEIQALDTNADVVYVGDSETQARVLRARETWVIGVDNLSTIYVDAVTAGDAVVASWVSLA